MYLILCFERLQCQLDFNTAGIMGRHDKTAAQNSWFAFLPMQAHIWKQKSRFNLVHSSSSSKREWAGDNLRLRVATNLIAVFFFVFRFRFSFILCSVFFSSSLLVSFQLVFSCSYHRCLQRWHWFCTAVYHPHWRNNSQCGKRLNWCMSQKCARPELKHISSADGTRRRWNADVTNVCGRRNHLLTLVHD